MITHRKEGRCHLYLYKTEYMSTKKLYELPECVVSRQTLTQRLSQAVINPERTGWESVHQCLTAKYIRGNPNGHVRHESPIDGNFVQLMMLMPVNDSKPRIMQSKPIA